MSIEDIELKNPDILTQEMGDMVLSSMFGEEEQGDVQVEQKPSSEAQLGEQEQEDIPNASIRLEKMRSQRDEERQQRLDLEKRLAQMEGKLSVLDKGESTDDVVDPTEYMDDTQRLLFNENQQLKETVKKLTDAVQNIQTEGSKKKLEEQENRFFENNPNLGKNREQFVEDMLEYLENKPAVKSMLKNGEVSLGEVYGMYSASKPKSTKTSEVSNPDRVFSGSSEPVQAGKSNSAELELARKKAMSILSSKDSTNKKQAVDFLQKDITDSILSQLDM